ncbi:MAG TPA: RecX family transcriptional regulator [Polyangiaceae bacterium]|jgi:regulatory protein|nr:RecX family transcriptional regulator [Polyangiaceae bacterium]
MRKPKNSPNVSREIRPPDVSRAGLDAAALRYLERFDCSSAKLLRVLTERLTKATRAGVDTSEARLVVGELLERYQASGLIDDRRFAQNFAARQRDRGSSRRMIEQKLRLRGISGELTQQVLAQPELRESELEAARAFARRRRLGPHRKPELREANRRKDLMALARAGFDFDTAARAIGHSSFDEDF